MLCGDLSAKEIQGRADTHINVADSLCYTAKKTDTLASSNYTPIKKGKGKS